MTSFKPREVARILEKLGFVKKRQAGSHIILYSEKLKQVIPVPFHRKDVKRGLVLSIIKKARSSETEFTKLK